MPPQVELLTIGDELLLGLRDNAHLPYLGALLTRHGLVVRRNSVVRDRYDEIAQAFRRAWDESDIVIATGGLGPTVDDLTREALAGVLGRSLERDPGIEQGLRDRFAKIGRTLTDNNFRQADRIAGALFLDNRFGTAPGQWLEADGKLLVVLPGPARELHPMVEEQVLPRLRQGGWAQAGEAYLQLRTFGVAESALDDRLRPILAPWGERVNLAFCAHEGLVDVRLAPVDPTVGWEDIQRIGEECRATLGDDFVGYGAEDLASLVVHGLRRRDQTLAVAESCTGGLLASAFTDVPGASKVFLGGIVCYNNDVKVQLLDVPECLILQHGAVSAECAAAMATGAAEHFGADHTLAITGFAGPGGGTRDNPVGTIYLGTCTPAGVWSHKAVYPGNRLAVKARAVNLALDWLRRHLAREAGR